MQRSVTGQHMFALIIDELKKLARTPSRWREVLRPRRWRRFASVLRFNARSGGGWQTDVGRAQFKQRAYSSYEEYVRHQQSKFAHLDLADYDVQYRQLLKERLANTAFLKQGTTVLCLGARQGTEVKAFHDLGCFAVGIDLNPGKQNRFVVTGDFHKVQFPSQSVDVIFTNSFDHVYDPAKLISEIKRLLKPEGILIIEVIQGEADEIVPDAYASFWWQRVDDLAALLAGNGFCQLSREPFQKPWPGEQLRFSAVLKS